MAFNYLSRNLTYERMYGSKRRVLKEDVIWDDGVVLIHVKAGFVCDFASIPNALKWAVSNDDARIIRPSVCHDKMYKSHKTNNGPVSRSQADILFYSMLRKERVGFIKARLMWLAVRVGGWKAWKKKD